MDTSQQAALSRAFEAALRLHPVFETVGAEKGPETPSASNAMLQSMFTPRLDLWREWIQYQSDFGKLWMTHVLSLKGAAPGQGTAPDRRFAHPAWNEGAFPFLRDSYSLTAQTMTRIADATGLPPREQRKLSFYTRLMADALSPGNYVMTNPEVLRRAQETSGQSLVDGFRNLLADLEKGHVSTTDEDAFEVGSNIATTEGSVVYRNELIELIQYHPVTAKVAARPVLIVPPCVNKFYIFDLNERKSMIRYMLEQGLSVYTISWRNPSPERDFGWDHYIETGIFEALTACLAISGADKADLLSWCNGGTMLTVGLAVMDKALKSRVGSATFLSSMIDFSDPGELEVFIDSSQIALYKQRMAATGVAPGRDIAHAMSLLHVNDSVWNFVISNYLLGQRPKPFDVLYWNADTSNLPAKWLTYYTEKMYHQNLLKEPGALEILGRPVDTRTIDVPCYFVAATGDHIVPWTTSYLATRLVGGPTEFVLTDGGHVSGTVINHPVKSRRSYRKGGDRDLAPEEWRAGAEEAQGSWWPHWVDWLRDLGDGAEITAPRQAGSSDHPVLAPAPGTYVTEAVRQDG